MRSVGADTFGQVLNVGIRLLLVPLFLSSWGAASYGEWLILTALAAWFSLGDLGGQLYFINLLTAEWVQGRTTQFQRILSTGLLFFVFSSTVLLLCALILIYWLPIPLWLGLKVINPDLSRAILLLISLRFILSLPVGFLMGIYRAIGLQATSIMYGNLILAIQFIASLVALLTGCGMLVLALLEVIPFLFVYAIALWGLRRRLPVEIRLFSLEKADKLVFRSAIFPSLHFLSLQFSAALMIQGSVLVVAKTLGAVDVAVFSSMRILANVMSRFMGVVAHAAWPELTRLVSLGQDAKLLKLSEVIFNITLFVGVSYVIFIRIYGEALYHWWLNNALNYDFWAMYLLSCQIVVNILWVWGTSILMATNRHEDYSRWQLLINFSALLICFWGGLNFGLSGAVTGLLIGQSIPMLLAVYFALRRHQWEQIANKMLKYSVLAITLFILTLHIWLGLIGIVVLGFFLISNLSRILRRDKLDNIS